MTREEAIKILADLTDNLFLHTWEEQYKALHMAIEALCEWVEEDEYGDLWVCDQCGFANEYMIKFCPICGAKMKGGDTE